MKKPKRLEGEGHVIKNVPTWIFSIVKNSMAGRKISKKLKSAVFPMLVLPSDFFVEGSDSKIFIFDKNMKRSDAYNRFTYADVSNRYKRLGAENFKEISLKLSEHFSLKIGGTPRLVPFLVPNKVITARIIDVEPQLEFVLGAIKPQSVRSATEFHFLDQVNKSLVHLYSTRYKEKLYPVIASVDGVTSIIYCKTRNFKTNRVYDFVVSGWHQMHFDGKIMQDTPVYYSWLENQVLETYSDIYKIIKNLNSYKMLYPNWLYDDDTNDILLSALVYMEQDMPCFNTVLFGPTRCGKSRTLDVFAKIFGEVVNSGSSQTTKGLVGSFSEKENIGAMLSSNYVFLCDEYFRTELGNDKNKTLDAQHIDYIMSKTIELLEHSNKIATSGNFKRRNFFDKSFICTNNVRDLNAFHSAFKNDPASFVRYSFLSLTTDEAKRFLTAFKTPSDYNKHYISNINKAGFNTTTLAKFFRLLRANLKWVKVTNEAFSKALKQLDYVDPKYDRKEKLVAMLKTRTLMNYVLREPEPFPLKKSIKPTDRDIDEAVRLVNRLTDGFKSVCGIK